MEPGFEGDAVYGWSGPLGRGRRDRSVVGGMTGDYRVPAKAEAAELGRHKLAAQGNGNAMRITLFPVMQAPEIARTFVRHRLLSLGGSEETVDNGCVLTSELVTSVLRHVPHAETFHLCVSKNGLSPLLEVFDPSPVRPVIKEDSDGESGRGLMIVAALATTWYHYLLPPEHGGGKIVAALL